MPKRKKARKKQGTGKLGFFAVIIAAAAAVLHFTGTFTLSDWKDALGISTAEVAEGQVQVHFIDVGQGDSELILSDGQAVLIDTGEKDQGETVCSYLESQGVETLDCLIITHPHSDHMGSASYVIDNMDIKQVITPKLPDDMVPTTKVYENFLTSVQNKGLKLTQAQPGLTIEIGQAELEIISPVSDDYDNINNFSAAAILKHGENSFLFTGDNEKEAEEDIIESGYLESVDVLKAGHHGSSTSSSSEFLEIVQPEYVVISCGEGNSYGHPHEKALNRLKKYTDKIYRTDIDGTIVMTSTQDGIEIETEN